MDFFLVFKIKSKSDGNADTDLPAGGGIRHKALQLSAMIRLASDRHSTMGNTTFWYNHTNNGKGARFVTNEVDTILNKNGNFHVCGRISICLFHTYIHFLLIKAGQCA